MILDQLIEKKELLAYCDLRMRRLIKSKQDELARVDPKKREQVAHKIDARIAELARLKNLVHSGNRWIKEETKANWRNLNPDVPDSYRLHEAENEIMGLEDALIVKKAEVVELNQRIAALEEENRQLRQEVEALRRDHAVFQGDAPKEERCHVWGGDVSRWKLPEFAPTGNAGDPGARMKCCASCKWMSLSWADRILLGWSAAICRHPKTRRVHQDPVSGKIIGRAASCSLVRQGRLSWIDGDSCGPEGRWWEARG